MAALSKPQHQRYTSETALARMEQGRCPECGLWPDDHTGWGNARCSLNDNGVAGRLWQYEKDKKEKAEHVHESVRERYADGDGRVVTEAPKARWHLLEQWCACGQYRYRIVGAPFTPWAEEES